MKGLSLLVALLCGAATAMAEPTPSPVGAIAYIISPADAAEVSNPVVIQFGLKGMGVAPAGVPAPNTGHHHLIIDSEPPPLDQPIAKDDKHLHFGGGQTEVTLELLPGQHTLQLLLGDHLHLPHNPAVISQQITITVK